MPYTANNPMKKELNRLSARKHRQRKKQYIAALEQRLQQQEATIALLQAELDRQSILYNGILGDCVLDTDGFIDDLLNSDESSFVTEASPGP
jgi:hypothetical protein